MTQDGLRDWLSRLEAHHSGEVAHGERVAVYAVAIAERLGQNEDFLSLLRCAAALHDVGKLALPGELLRVERPSGAQVLRLREHAAQGSNLVIGELGAEGSAWIAAHHERWDGYGYPDGLARDEIPLGARMISVAETFDVLAHDGRWRPRMSDSAALDEVRRCAGTQFDPEAVEAFLAVQPLIQPIRLAD